ncbi:hypothetical protein ACCO45_001147 [Purpureocillium lilacinum]|uniref:Uncharacterized protein n=1 Tax=Purpureocillium lilacinum TaxID=33203 RepID=A0ACC4E7F0_PURLI
MLPTPDTSHVPYERVYEPAEDSFLLLDTLSSDSERAFLRDEFSHTTPLVVELGTGSGVVLAFVHAHAETLFGTRRVLTAGVDMNAYACRATVATARRAQADNPATHGMPARPEDWADAVPAPGQTPSFDDDSYLLSLSYAGGMDGMETTDRLIERLPQILSPRGCAYILLCAQNKPNEVKKRIEAFGPEWRALTVGSSGKTAGWEKLQVIRIWRDTTGTS